MKVQVHFLIGLLSILTMCFQANRGTRGGATRRISKLISNRADTYGKYNRTMNSYTNLIELTPDFSNGSASVSRSNLTSKQEQKQLIR